MLLREVKAETAVTFPRGLEYERRPSARLHSMEDALEESWKTRMGTGTL
jgi:hypothetical protein